MSTWSGVAEAYAASFGTLCAGTLPRMLADLPDDPLLDAGCGTGSLLAAATATGRRATGIDSDPGMVRHAQAATTGAVAAADLIQLPLADDAFASVAANFVVNHLPDPRAGVRELARVTRRGGRVAMTIWPAGGATWAHLLNRAFDAAGATAPTSVGLPPDKDFARSVEGLAALAGECGLQVLSAEMLAWQWVISPGDLWRGISGGIAGAGSRYQAQAPEVRRDVARGFRENAAAAAGADGLLRFRCEAVYLLARKP